MRLRTTFDTSLPDFRERSSLLKNTLYARFGPRSGPKHTVFGVFWSFRSLIRSYCALSADFFNRLVCPYSIS
jgi:hypothetical protein